MSNALVECVPNFSEGRNKQVIDAIAHAIQQTPGCYLLDVDPGASTNRTVYTFVGAPDDVIKGALAAARVAFALINMEIHKGSHPRIGAMDVCPFIPIKNITIEDCVELSKAFAQLLSEELDIPVYLYAESQPLKYRSELSDIRQGEYEKLREKLIDPRMMPDFGPTDFRANFGACCVGARHFLVAYNVNLIGTKEQAHRIALNVREQGRSEREPGRLKKVKAIGWWVDESNMAQISMNLVDFKQTNIHEAFEECDRDARALNLATCGSQVVGLIPLESILMAAEYYIKRDNLMILEEDQKVKMVIHRLGLNSMGPFNPKERIIDYIIEDRLSKNSDEKKFQNMSLKAFASLVGARTPAPGGGCVAALVAGLGSALACMSALLTYGNKKFEKYDSEIREILPEFYDSYNQLIAYVDRDARAFNSFVDAKKMEANTDKEKIEKEDKIRNALIECIDVPFSVATKANQLWPLLVKLAPLFNIETKSDLLVATKCLETGIYGAYENVLINAKGFDPTDELVNKYKQVAEAIWKDAQIYSSEVIKLIQQRNV